MATGVALDCFIDEDGYRALDALSELREATASVTGKDTARSAIGPR
jgi:hypothetical protein